MTYQRAGVVAIVKRILGWLLFIPALLSTLISVLNLVYQQDRHTEGMSAVMLDFAHIMVDMLRANTTFLNILWHNSPTPQWQGGFSGANVMFLLIYWLIFVGLAQQSSGARMARQLKYVREGLEDQLILERAKGSEGHTREQLEQKIDIPHHTLLRQFFTLYALPVIIGVGTYLFLKLTGLLG